MSASKEDGALEKHSFAAMAIGVVLGLSACQPPPAPAATPVVPPAATTAAQVSSGPKVTEAPPASVPAPVVKGDDFSGEGDKLTRPVVFEPGVTRMLAVHQGPGDFAVQIMGPDGAAVPALSAQGEYTGAVAFQVGEAGGADLAPGSYQVRIITSGPWGISVRRQTWAQGQAPPFAMARTGNNVLSPIRLDAGEVRLRFTYKSDSAFTARLLHQDGKRAFMVGRGVGPYDGDRRVTVGTDASSDLVPGIYLLAVQADGEWTASMEP